jgi:archaeal flagellar protein FlaJ
MAEAANADDVRLTRRQKFYNAYADYPLPFGTYLTQQFFPVAVVEIAVGLGAWAFFPEIFFGWTLLLLIGLLFWGSLALVLYPVYSYERRGKTIDKDMHLFVTRIGAMSTDDVSRQSLRDILGEMKDYRELSKEVEKIHKLTVEWNVALPHACRLVAERTPSDLMSDFLYRLGHAVESGETAEEFFAIEQKVSLELFSNKYNAALRGLLTLSDLYQALTISVAFLLTFLFMAPLFTAQGISAMLVGGLAIFVALELFFYFMVRYMLPDEQLWYDGKLKSQAQRRINRWFVFGAGLSAGLFALSVFVLAPFYPTLEFFLAVSLSGFLVPGFEIYRADRAIRNRETMYPAFMRSLGASAEATGRTGIDALRKLSQHKFGRLTRNIEDLYKRTATRIDRKSAWDYFGAETGSDIIAKFSEMFEDGTRTGGNPRKIAKVISDNFLALVSLRRLRYQEAGRLVGMMYGLGAVLVAVLYMSLFLVEGFQRLFAGVQPVPGFAFLAILRSGPVDVVAMNFVILGIVVVHAAVTGLVAKAADGGHKYGAVTHFVLMLWVAAAASVVTQFVMQAVF